MLARLEGMLREDAAGAGGGGGMKEAEEDCGGGRTAEWFCSVDGGGKVFSGRETFSDIEDCDVITGVLLK